MGAGLVKMGSRAGAEGDGVTDLQLEQAQQTTKALNLVAHTLEGMRRQNEDEKSGGEGVTHTDLLFSKFSYQVPRDRAHANALGADGPLPQSATTR